MSRFGRGKDDGPGEAPAPDASTRVEDPTQVLGGSPPSAGDRVEEPAASDPSDGPAKVLSDGGAGAGPQSPAPSTADTAESPAVVLPDSKPEPVAAEPPKDEPAKVLPPSASDRVDSPPPAASALVSAPPPTGSPVAAPASLAVAPPPQPGQLVSAAPPAAAATTCPQCGAAAEAGQEVCIACGSRIARARPAGKQRGWLPAALLAGLAVLLLGTGAAFAIVELTQDDEVEKKDVADLNETTQPTTPPPANTPPAGTAPTEPTPTIPPASGGDEPGTTTPEPTTPESTPTPDTGGEIAEWPSGKTAYTVVLVSATSRNAADAKAEQAIKRGIKAGVLRSDDFSTLRPGYWVVFAGQYDSSEQATRAADRYAEQGFGGGYPRQVKPK